MYMQASRTTFLLWTDGVFNQKKTCLTFIDHSLFLIVEFYSVLRLFLLARVNTFWIDFSVNQVLLSTFRLSLQIGMLTRVYI